jgi:putative hemolysin
LDDEVSATKITNNGSLWILGLKTEADGTVIKTNANGKTELLGALIYPAVNVQPSSVAFSSTNASVSYVYAESSYCASCGYSIKIKQVQQGASRTVQAPQKGHYVMPLFIGIQ